MDNQLSNKDLEQQIVWRKWKESGYRGTYKGTTGVGKTKIGAVAAGHLIRFGLIDKALIIVPTENLRDNEWQNEFKLWGYEPEMKEVTFECIQTAYKRTGDHWPLVIVDEIHTALSPEYRSFFENNTFDRLLCLTATIDDQEKLAYLNRIAPIFYETSLDKAVALGLVSGYKVYNLGLEFTSDELEAYKKADKMFAKTFGIFRRDLSTMYKCMDVATFKRYCVDNNIDYETYASFPFVCNQAMLERKQLLYNAFNKIAISKQLAERFVDRKALIFSESIDFASKIAAELGESCVLFHSKMKKQDKIKSLALFGTDGTGVTRMSAVKALNAGFNVPACSLGIVASGTSKALDFKQRLGRTIRWEEDKVAVFVQLYIKDTQEVKWIYNRCKNVKHVEWISSIDEIKEVPNYGTKDSNTTEDRSGSRPAVDDGGPGPGETRAGADESLAHNTIDLSRV